MTSPDAEGRNLRRLALVQAVFRVGWIFKTESIVIPAALDSIAGAAWIRGWLPLLSRLGLSLTPAILGRHIRNAGFKKVALANCFAAMAACMGLLSLLWYGQPPQSLMVAGFLVVYATFFALHGLNHVAFGTLQGKLIAADQRGRLMVLANVSSSIVGVTLVVLLLPRWLQGTTPRFEMIFLMPAIWFGVSAALTRGVTEEPDQPATRFTTSDFVRSTLELVRQSPTLRQALLVAFLTGFALVLFPHYQAMARERLGLAPRNLTTWIVVQSVGAAIASVVAGFSADRFGNRVVLQVILAGMAATPFTAMGLAQFPSVGAVLYPVVFMCIGLTPVMFRVFQNYIIEVTEDPHRPQALSAMTLSLAVPVISSPGVGIFIDKQGFFPAFIAIAMLVWAAWGLSFWLNEPRGGS